MKFILAATCSLASIASASIITFDQPTYPAPPGSGDPYVDNPSIVGVDGWTSSEADLPVDPFPGVGFSPYFYTTDAGGGDQWGVVGGFYAAPTASTYSVNRDLDLNGAPFIGAVGFGVDLAIQDVTSFPGNDSYVFTLSQGSDLVTIFFEPIDATGSTEWLSSYQFAGGAKTSFGLGSNLDAGTVYDLQAVFNLDGTIDISLTDTAFVSTTYSATGTPTGYDPLSSDPLGFQVDWIQNGANGDFGDGGIALNNITTVPEPGILALVLLGGIGMFRRQRR